MNLFSEYKNTYEKASTIPQQNDYEEVLFFAGLVGEGTSEIIDIGCAEGRLVCELAKNGHSVTGADISYDFLEQTKKLAKANNLNIRTALLDIEKDIKHVADNKYDIIFLNDIIEHLRNPVAALHNIRKLMGTESKLYIHTPNCVTPARFKWYLIHPHARINFFDPKELGDFHFSTYDQITLEKTLNFVGLSVNKMIPTRFTSLGIYRIAKIFKNLPYRMARAFPHLSDTLLFECSRCEPIDLNKQLEYWKNNMHA